MSGVEQHPEIRKKFIEKHLWDFWETMFERDEFVNYGISFSLGLKLLFWEKTKKRKSKRFFQQLDPKKPTKPGFAHITIHAIRDTELQFTTRPKTIHTTISIPLFLRIKSNRTTRIAYRTFCWKYKYFLTLNMVWPHIFV